MLGTGSSSSRYYAQFWVQGTQCARAPGPPAPATNAPNAPDTLALIHTSGELISFPATQSPATLPEKPLNTEQADAFDLFLKKKAP